METQNEQDWTATRESVKKLNKTLDEVALLLSEDPLARAKAKFTEFFSKQSAGK